MLSKKHRITTKEFKHLGRSLRVWNGPLFNIRFHNTDARAPKFAVVVSKKVSASAVRRNILKRRLFSILRDVSTRVQQNLTIIIFVKKEAVGAPFHALKAAIEGVHFF